MRKKSVFRNEKVTHDEYMELTGIDWVEMERKISAGLPTSRDMIPIRRALHWEFKQVEKERHLAQQQTRKSLQRIQKQRRFHEKMMRYTCKSLYDIPDEILRGDWAKSYDRETAKDIQKLIKHLLRKRLNLGYEIKRDEINNAEFKEDIRGCYDRWPYFDFN